MTPEVREVIRKVRDEVLTGPERWTQGRSACRADGTSISLFRGLATIKEEAVRYCLETAVAIGAGRVFGRAYDRALDVLRDEAGLRQLHEWNDHPSRTFADVRALLDRALEEGGH